MNCYFMGKNIFFVELSLTFNWDIQSDLCSLSSSHDFVSNLLSRCRPLCHREGRGEDRPPAAPHHHPLRHALLLHRPEDSQVMTASDWSVKIMLCSHWSAGGSASASPASSTSSTPGSWGRTRGIDSASWMRGRVRHCSPLIGHDVT